MSGPRKRLRHDGLPPLPQVECRPLRALVEWQNVLERMLADEHVPEKEVPSGWGNSGCGIPITALQQLDAACHIHSRRALQDCQEFAAGQIREVYQQALRAFRDENGTPKEADGA